MTKMDKYAVIKSGGQQYLVRENQLVEVEKISGQKGDKLSLGEVLLIKGKAVLLGKPVLKKARVRAEILEQFKAKKIRIAKFRAKSRYRLTKGHRQQKTKVRILKISS
jgi:large subunit ribosomal protein L21